MSIFLIEDPKVDRLHPVATARLCAAVTCGGLRLVDLIESLNTPTYSLARTHLQAIQRLDHPVLQEPKNAPKDSHPKLVLSARLAPTVETLQTLEKLLKEPEDAPTTWLVDRGIPVGVLHPNESYEAILNQGRGYLEVRFPKNTPPEIPMRTLAVNSFQYPHDVIRTHMASFAANLHWLIARREYQQIRDGVFVGKGVKIPDWVCLDVDAGPMVLEDGVQVGPFSLLRGPLYLGRKCKVLEHASLKDGVCAGHTTKIGGEVEASIIEPYTNKQHHGFLGHSYVGSWVNLGAGTCTSDLKNTYGLISMEYPAGRVATGMQFLGCFIGDYSKSAINTSIFTGKWIGVCSAMYGFVTTNVPSFSNYAKLFGQVAPLPSSVMISTQQRMFSRRSVEQRQCDIDLIHALFDLTRSDREGLIGLD